MAEAKETTKKTTTRKTTPKTTTKKTEEVAVQTPSQIEEMKAQVEALMEMVAKQQQVIDSYQKQPVAEVVAEAKPTKIRKTTGRKKGVTKAQLRRKYQNVDVYLVFLVSGSASYVGRNGYEYLWTYIGDVQAVPIEDVLDMPEDWLKSPWVGIDEADNDEELIEDLVTCLGLEPIYEHLFILNELDEDINNIDIEKIKAVISKASDSTLSIDIATIVQEKIKNGELTNYHLISDFEKVLGRNFKKTID